MDKGKEKTVAPMVDQPLEDWPVEAFCVENFAGEANRLHSHSLLEIFYCSSGGEILMDGRTLQLVRGDILFIPPGCIHAFRPLEAEGGKVCGFCIRIRMDFITLLREGFPYMQKQKVLIELPLRTAGTKWAYLAHSFQVVVDEVSSRRPGYESAVIGIVIRLLTDLTRALEDVPDRTGTEGSLTERLQRYVDAHLYEKMTVQTVAEHFVVSASTVGHLFTREMGISFHRYVILRRLIAARKQILDGVPIEEVSSQVGFGDYSSFYRAFKREYGCSPKQFRNGNSAAGGAEREA